MRRQIHRACACLFVILFAGISLHAQSRLSIRAASVEPVNGWQKMQLEHCQSRCDRWLAPTPVITESDIEKAQPEVRADGYRVIKVVYTDTAVNKMRDLTAAQVKKPIALVVDGKLLWAPQVNYAIGDKESSMTGSTPTGLTQEEVDVIMSILGPAR
jgi:preprotein translocase subunit SecD